MAGGAHVSKDLGAGQVAESGNGARAATLGELLGERQDLLMHCVHCGFCLSSCPTYTRLGDEADSPRGRLYLMRAAVEGRVDPASDAFQTHIDRCLGCRACEPVCPSGVEYGLLLEAARGEAAKARPAPLLARILLFLVERRWALRAWGWASRLFRVSGMPAAGVRLLPNRGVLGSIRTGLAMLVASGPARRGFPPPPEAESQAPASPPEPAPVQARPGPGGRGTAGPEAGSPRTGLFRGCVQDALFGRVNRATQEVLEANGHAVACPAGQGCCGALHAHAGEVERARDLARRNVRAFADSEVETVVVNAAGCGAVMKEYGELLANDPQWAGAARDFSERVRDVSEVLAGGDNAPLPGGRIPARVAYDPPCHLLHAQRVDEPPRRLLAAIPGLEVTAPENASECCGGAGIYGLTHPELGGRITGDKATAVAHTGAQALATGNPGCMMQIGAGLQLRGTPLSVVHPVELLAESYRRADRAASPPPEGEEEAS